MLQSNLPLSGTTSVSLNPIDYSASSIAYCVRYCASVRENNRNVDMLLYSYSECKCVNYISTYNPADYKYEGRYCYISTCLFFINIVFSFEKLNALREFYTLYIVNKAIIRKTTLLYKLTSNSVS